MGSSPSGHELPPRHHPPSPGPPAPQALVDRVSARLRMPRPHRAPRRPPARSSPAAAHDPIVWTHARGRQTSFDADGQRVRRPHRGLSAPALHSGHTHPGGVVRGPCAAQVPETHAPRPSATPPGLPLRRGRSPFEPAASPRAGPVGPRPREDARPSRAAGRRGGRPPRPPRLHTPAARACSAFRGAATTGSPTGRVSGVRLQAGRFARPFLEQIQQRRVVRPPTPTRGRRGLAPGLSLDRRSIKVLATASWARLLVEARTGDAAGVLNPARKGFVKALGGRRAGRGNAGGRARWSTEDLHGSPPARGPRYRQRRPTAPDPRTCDLPRASPSAAGVPVRGRVRDCVDGRGGRRAWGDPPAGEGQSTPRTFLGNPPSLCAAALAAARRARGARDLCSSSRGRRGAHLGRTPRRASPATRRSAGSRRVTRTGPWLAARPSPSEGGVGNARSPSFGGAMLGARATSCSPGGLFGADVAHGSLRRARSTGRSSSTAFGRAALGRDNCGRAVEAADVSSEAGLRRRRVAGRAAPAARTRDITPAEVRVSLAVEACSAGRRGETNPALGAASPHAALDGREVDVGRRHPRGSPRTRLQARPRVRGALRRPARTVRSFRTSGTTRRRGAGVPTSSTTSRSTRLAAA